MACGDERGAQPASRRKLRRHGLDAGATTPGRSSQRRAPKRPRCAGTLAALPERQRLVLFLRYYADLSYAEIGEALGLRTGTVSATLAAAHRTLRARLQPVAA